MTTKVLIVNYGPKQVLVDVIDKGFDGSPDQVAREDVVYPQNEKWWHVYDSRYLVVKEGV